MSDTVIETSERGIDPSTGMPSLPPGYRWKVWFPETEYDFAPSLEVKLQKKGRLFWHTIGSKRWDLGWEKSENLKLNEYETALSKTEVEHPRGYKYLLIDPSEYPTLILDLAQHVLDQHAASLTRAAWFTDFYLAEKRIAGTYPPKKLDA